MIWKKLGQGIAKGVGKAANTVDEAVDGVKNIIYDIAENAAETREAVKGTYRSTRNKSPKVQREIEEGVRDASGRKRTPVKEARNSSGTNEAASEAISQPTAKPVSGYRTNTSFIHDGVSYRRTKGGGFERRSKVDGEWGDWEGISKKQYGKARSKYISDNEALEQAGKIATTETAETAGFNLGEFIDNHPVIAGGTLLGGGFLLSEMLDDD